MSDLNSILKNLDWNTKRPFGWSTSPDADWRVIFTGTALLMVLASLLNLSLFIGVEKGRLFASEEPETEDTLTLNTAELERTLEYYEKKASEFQKIINGAGTAVVDPSL
jgi:hypothetical protein